MRWVRRIFIKNTTGWDTEVAKLKRLVEMLDTSMCQKPAARMNFRGIRSSKFRHVYGQPAKKVSMIIILSELQNVEQNEGLDLIDWF